MNDYTLEDLKLIYRTLHRHLTDNVELMDSDFFTDLQRHLQKHALEQGVDVSDHGEWDSWLGNEAVSCAVRVQDRSVIEP